MVCSKTVKKTCGTDIVPLSGFGKDQSDFIVNGFWWCVLSFGCTGARHTKPQHSPALNSSWETQPVGCFADGLPACLKTGTFHQTDSDFYCRWHINNYTTFFCADEPLQWQYLQMIFSLGATLSSESSEWFDYRQPYLSSLSSLSINICML